MTIVMVRTVAVAGLCFALSPDEYRPTSGRSVFAADTGGARNPFIAPGIEDTGWPFIRGPGYDGHSSETRLADRWSDDGPPVLWTRELGQGYSSFAAWSDRIATQTQTLSGQYVVCLHADTGKTIWEYWYDWPYEAAGLYPGPRATPTYADGHVYFAAPNGEIGCLAADDGTLVWSINPTKRFDGQGTDFGYSCSPTVVDHLVVVPVGAKGASIVALDARDGKVVWKSGDDPASYAPVYPIRFGEQDLLLGYLQNALVCLERTTGRQVWRRTLSHGYDEHSAWPIYREPYLWISGPFKAGSQLFKLTGDEEQPLISVWTSPLLSNDIFSSVLHEDAIYGFDLREAQAKAHRPSRGKFRCLEFLTGKPLWEVGEFERRSLDGPKREDTGKRVGHANVIVADGKLILLNDTGELILAKANPDRFEELARTNVLSGELCWTGPALYRGRLFVRNHSRAACVYLGKLEFLDAETKLLTPADIPQAEFVDMTAAILGVEPEYAFDIPSGQWLWEWYWMTACLLAASGIVAIGIAALVPRHFAKMANHHVFLATAFALGAIGTTLLSRWRGDFVFTWQLSIFATFYATVASYANRARPVGESSDARPGKSWRGRLPGLVFIASCVLYFLICRRLSLVFEWVFLCGFAGALPFALIAAFCFREKRWYTVWACLLTVVAYTAFYWTAVAVLLLRAR